MKPSFYILYKFLTLQAFEKTLESWALKASLRDNVNDPLENIPLFESCEASYSVAAGQEGWDIPPFFSFTRCMSIPAMWGHYAGNANGICMVFMFPVQPVDLGQKADFESITYGTLDKSALYSSGLADIIEDTTFLPLHYTQNRVPADSVYFDAAGKPKLNHELMRTKAKCWKYEQEVRIICDIKHADKIIDNMLLYTWPMRFFIGAIRGPKCDTSLLLLKKKIDYYYAKNKKETPNFLIEKKYLNHFIVRPSHFSPTEFSITAVPFQDHMTDCTFWQEYHSGAFNKG